MTNAFSKEAPKSVMRRPPAKVKQPKSVMAARQQGKIDLSLFPPKPRYSSGAGRAEIQEKRRGAELSSRDRSSDGGIFSEFCIVCFAGNIDVAHNVDKRRRNLHHHGEHGRASTEVPATRSNAEPRAGWDDEDRNPEDS